MTDEKAIEIAAYALRRKEAWARLAGYFAFALGMALIVLAIISAIAGGG
jgi:predicted anti-sigma-YlaC factor YlaD